MPIRVLFVCLGNICRSPAAEAAFLHLVAARRARSPSSSSTRRARARGTSASGRTRGCGRRADAPRHRDSERRQTGRRATDFERVRLDPRHGREQPRALRAWRQPLGARQDPAVSRPRPRRSWAKTCPTPTTATRSTSTRSSTSSRRTARALLAELTHADAMSDLAAGGRLGPRPRRSARRSSIRARRPLAGGSINRTQIVETTAGTFVVKSNRHAPAGMFQAEADGLAALRSSGSSFVIPRVVAVHDGSSGVSRARVSRRRRRSVQRLRRAARPRPGGAPSVDERPLRFPTATTSAARRRSRTRGPTRWVDFYAASRLGHQARLASDAGTARCAADTAGDRSPHRSPRPLDRRARERAVAGSWRSVERQSAPRHRRASRR